MLTVMAEGLAHPATTGRRGGRASRLKAYHVERNRLFVVAKNFPGRMLWAAPLFAASFLWSSWTRPVS